MGTGHGTPVVSLSMGIVSSCVKKNDGNPDVSSTPEIAHNTKLKTVVENEPVSSSKTVSFHLVRHGETDYNRTGKIQGHMDIPLNENGMNQAKELGKCIPHFVPSVDAVVASPVLRGKQTGEEIHRSMGDDSITFAVMDAFAELHYGDLVDTLLVDCNGTVVDLKEKQWASGKWDASFPGEEGESFQSIVDRMEQGFVELGKKCEDGANIIVATHSQCIEAFLVYLKAFSYTDIEERARNKNCTVSTIALNVDTGAFSVEKVFQDMTVHIKKIGGINQG